MDTFRSLNVFLCHSSNDKSTALALSKRLKADGINPWLDVESLLPGQNWELEIRRAVRSADAIIICLSRNSVTKFGYIQKEIRLALDIADEKPENVIFLIPLRLEDCEIPDRLRALHWVNLYEDVGYSRLLEALKVCAQSLQIDPHGKARQLLDLEIKRWLLNGTFIPKESLEILHENLSALDNLDDNEWKCIITSAFKANVSVNDWVSQAGRSAINPLAELLCDGTQREQEIIAKIFRESKLSEITNQLLDTVNRKGLSNIDIAVNLIVDLDSTATDRMLIEVSNRNWCIRAIACSALGKLNDSRAVQPLLNLLWDENDIVVERTARSLGHLKAKEAVLPLIGLLSNKEKSSLIDTVSWSLGEIGDAVAVIPMISLLDGTNSQIDTVDALGKLGGSDARQTLIALLESISDEDYLSYPEFASSIFHGLGNIGGNEAVFALEKALDHDQSYGGMLVDEIMDALKQIGTEDAQNVIIDFEYLHDYDDRDPYAGTAHYE